MKRHIILYILLYITALHTADDTYCDTDSGSSTLAKSIQNNLANEEAGINSPKFNSPRKLKPGEQKRLNEFKSNYLIESAAEPSRRAAHGSPKEQKMDDDLHIQFDQRPLLAYHAITETFRIIKDKSELQNDESLHPCSPRLTAKEIRERYKIENQKKPQ